MAGKSWEELTIQDNFIFGKSMETSPKICKWLLEKILHIKVKNELDTVVQKIKRNKDWRSEYMRYEHELAAREHLAMEAGVEKGKVEMILELLRKNQPLSFISEVSKYSVYKIAEIGRTHGFAVIK